jgi:FkbM family methyltransferase
LPKPGDVVLDIGTGYGHEVVWLNERVSGINYVCIEPNPEVFCYLRLNTAHLNNVDLINCFVGDKKSVTFSINLDYASSDSIISSDFGWKVEGISLNEIIDKYEKIDLLKLNIEGGELELLTNNNLDKVNRIIVSCHDFRGIRGDGDFFYTYEKVSNSLIEKGYKISNLVIEDYPNSSWEASIPYWIYAEKI